MINTYQGLRWANGHYPQTLSFQISMSVPSMRQTIVIQMLFATIPMDPTSVVVKLDTRGMEGIVQVEFAFEIVIVVVKYGLSLSLDCLNITAVVTGCVPACGANASCLETGARPLCECNPGFEGDGYVCAG